MSQGVPCVGCQTDRWMRPATWYLPVSLTSAGDGTDRRVAAGLVPDKPLAHFRADDRCSGHLSHSARVGCSTDFGHVHGKTACVVLGCGGDSGQGSVCRCVHLGVSPELSADAIGVNVERTCCV